MLRYEHYRIINNNTALHDVEHDQKVDTQAQIVVIPKLLRLLLAELIVTVGDIIAIVGVSGLSSDFVVDFFCACTWGTLTGLNVTSGSPNF